MEPQKCDDIEWFPIGARPENMMHHVREAIQNVEKGIIYSELGVGYIQKLQQQ